MCGSSQVEKWQSKAQERLLEDVRIVVAETVTGDSEKDNDDKNSLFFYNKNERNQAQ